MIFNMNMKYIFLICVMVHFNLAFGQANTTKNGTPPNKKNGLVIGYYGYKFENPGLQAGLERYLATTTNFQVIASFLAQFHHQKDQQTAIALNVRAGQRYTSGFGLMLESHLGIGLQHTYYTSIEYDLTNKPITSQKVGTNKTGILPNIAVGLGYDFSKKADMPLIFYFRPAISWLYPDRNLVFSTSGSFEAGIILTTIL